MAVTEPPEYTFPAVIVPDVLIGCVVDHASLAAAPTEYWAMICRRVVTSDAEDISTTV
jgi:hypothetical protein